MDTNTKITLTLFFMAIWPMSIFTAFAIHQCKLDRLFYDVDSFHFYSQPDQQLWPEWAYQTIALIVAVCIATGLWYIMPSLPNLPNLPR